jgi:DNA modification methylase
MIDTIQTSLGGQEDTGVPAPARNLIETNISRGDLITLGRHRVLCGDCTNPVDVTRLLNGAEIDCLITDPPYCSGGFQEAGRSAGSIGSTVKRAIKNDTLSTRGYQTLLKATLSIVDLRALYIFTDWRMWVNLFDLVEASGYGVRSMIVWDKKSMGLGLGWRAQHELILHARTSSASALFDNKIGTGNVVAISRTGNKHHPTEKPVQLIEEILKITAGARTVYDPFAGSGTTLLACEARGRSCYASEMVPEFCQVIVNRWERATGLQAVIE